MDKPWLNHYPKGVEAEIDFSDKPSDLVQLFRDSCQRYGQSPAFTSFGVSMTFNQLLAKTDALASYLQSLSLQKGDRVALMMPNLLQYPIAIFGVLQAGLTVVNCNPVYTARELQYQLQDSGARVIIVCANFAHTLAQVIDKTSIEFVIVTEIGDQLGDLKGRMVNFAVRYIKRMVPPFDIAQAKSFNDCLSQGAKRPLQPVTIVPDDLAFLQYTGGTTGIAKGTMLSHRNMAVNVLQCVEWVGVDLNRGHEIALGALPFYHIFALTVCCFCFLTLGANCLLITNPRDLPHFIKEMIAHPPTVYIGINTLFAALLNHRKFERVDCSDIKLAVSGGMATNRIVAQRWQERTGVSLVEGYGLTEASPVTMINPLNITTFNGSIGLPISNTEAVIRDEQGNDLAIGEVGELWVRGPQVMQGYWQKPDETAIVLMSDGWLDTGDIARMDETGLVYIVDRKKDMILVSGFNVYPNEIEEVLSGHPAIQEVAVIGVPSPDTGEMVKAYVVGKDDNLTKDDIIAYARRYLTAYKVPKSIAFCQQLPKTNVGKVLRRALREQEHGRSGETT